MLHESNSSFDAVKFLKRFIELLEANHFTVVTYRDITEDQDITARDQGHLAIITIDDIYLQAKPNESVKGMISSLLAAHYPAVLGVVTQGKTANAETAALLFSLSQKGWEIAAHTDTHPYLGDLEKTSPQAVYLEIKTSQDKIETVVGLRPITLVLPYGQMVANTTEIQKANILWIAGIGGGNTYDATKTPVFVGREAGVGEADWTFKMMMRRFNP